MTRKEEITKKIDSLEYELCVADSRYELATRTVEVCLEKKIKLNEQINDLKEELQELESENPIAPLNSAISTLKNYCYITGDCGCCLIRNICEEVPCGWDEIE